jgi:hypothetical protein
VIGVARHSETEENFVVYRALYGDEDLWIRPAAMFVESVVVEGRVVSRFQFLDDLQDPASDAPEPPTHPLPA